MENNFSAQISWEPISNRFLGFVKIHGNLFLTSLISITVLTHRKDLSNLITH